jgi:hypothetical protein
MPVARLGRRMLAQYEPFLHGPMKYPPQGGAKTILVLPQAHPQLFEPG